MMVSIFRNRELKWFGHVTRHNNKLPLVNKIMHGRAPGKRRRGRPRASWMQNIRGYTGLSATEAVRAAHDRKDWEKELRTQQCSYGLSRLWTRERREIGHAVTLRRCYENHNASHRCVPLQSRHISPIYATKPHFEHCQPPSISCEMVVDFLAMNSMVCD